MGIQQIPLEASGASLAEITTAIQNNASPYGGTWANLGTHTTSGVTTVTFSNLGGYKYLRIYAAFSPSISSQFQRLRFNGDTGANYVSSWNAPVSGHDFNTVGSLMNLGYQTGGAQFWILEIKNANSTTTNKHITSLNTGFGDYGGTFAGVYKSTNAVSSLTFLCNTGFWSDVYINILGAN